MPLKGESVLRHPSTHRVMIRTRWKLALGSVALAAVVMAIAGWLLWHRPAFYLEALDGGRDAGERRAQSKKFVQATLQLVDEIRHEESWSQDFPDAAVNSWLADELPTRYGQWLPAGVESPRVRFEQDRIRLAFQARHGAWTGVISADLRVWASSPDEVAVEISALRAGRIPVPVDDVVGELVRAMQADGWKIEWRPSDAGDALVITLDAATFRGDGSERPALESIDVQPGLLRIRGSRRRAVARREGDARTSAE